MTFSEEDEEVSPVSLHVNRFLALTSNVAICIFQLPVCTSACHLPRANGQLPGHFSLEKKAIALAGAREPKSKL